MMFWMIESLSRVRALMFDFCVEEMKPSNNSEPSNNSLLWSKL